MILINKKKNSEDPIENNMNYNQNHQMKQDAVLPEDITFSKVKNNKNNHYLITGATGFLGRYLVADILEHTNCRISCLVRSENSFSAMNKLRQALSSTRRNININDKRLELYCGDVSQSNFGLKENEYNLLAEKVDTIIHAAAEVNWIKSYAELREVNITGMLNMILFAARAQQKAILFVSTISVCFSENAPSTITESTNMFDFIAGMPLGYAQTKCVSEQLLKEAVKRGMSGVIIRPGLLCGDSVTGQSNLDDIISCLIKGAVTQKCTADVDWIVDFYPVDYAARAITSISLNQMNCPEVIHLHHPHPRRWRELILWTNLNGYKIELIAFNTWIKLLNNCSRRECRELYSLKQFFTGRPALLNGKRLPELYLEQQQTQISSAHSNQYLKSLGLTPPPIDSTLLSGYFEGYRQARFLPEIITDGRLQNSSAKPDKNNIQSILEKKHPNSKINIINYKNSRLDQGSIIGELYGHNTNTSGGNYLYSVQYTKDNLQEAISFEMFVKVKPDKSVADKIAITLAGLYHNNLMEVAHLIPDALCIAGSLEREVSLYSSAEEILQRHIPQLYGYKHDTQTGAGALFIEYLHDVEMLNSLEKNIKWSNEHIQCALRDIAKIHAIWYGNDGSPLFPLKDNDLNNQPDEKEMLPLWLSLADSTHLYLSRIWGNGALFFLKKLISELNQTKKELAELSKTLIHNDFNPRNIAFRKVHNKLHLTLYDWELCSRGVPQRDLAELLCYTINNKTTQEEISNYINYHRYELEKNYGKEINSTEWKRGFILSLEQFLIERLLLYILVEKFKPTNYLNEIFNNWLRIYKYFAPINTSYI